MTNRSKQRGTAWESAIVAYLIDRGWIHTERRTLNGAKDRGDISGLPGVMVEAKSEKSITLGTYLREVETQTANANAEVGVAWVKRRGKTSPGDAYVVMTGDQFTELLKKAGW